MNILYMHTHDTGRYIEPYGFNVPTPHLMGLAAEGTLFRQAFCAGPTCSPSRAALLTGMSPHAAGMIGLAHRGFALKDYGQHLVQFLNQQGYQTVLCGVQHEAASSEALGYQKVISHRDATDPTSSDVNNAKQVVRYLQQAQEPFFLSFGMWNTHREFPKRDPQINPNHVQVPFPLHDNAANREDFAAYITAAGIVDGCVGQVLQALAESGLAEKTLVIFTTDHGIAFPKMKCNLYDTGIGVSLIVRAPGSKLQGAASDALVSHVDVFPTICELAGLPQPDYLEGVSLAPILRGEATEVRDRIFAEVTYHAAYEPMRCIRTQRFKLIRHFHEHNRHVPANIDDSPPKTFLLEQGMLDERRSKEMLFDVFLDPTERVNLVGDSRYQAVYQELSQGLAQWMQDTDDPLLDGPVPRPEGAIVNRQRCTSPQEDDYED